MSHEYEKLGAFYLGKVFDQQQGKPTEQLLLYDSKDLTTHAVCVGMTGSGKTGLCISLLEEAAIDKIPAIAIDPKGDLANLALTFPQLRPEDFQPWIEPEAAARQGKSVEEYAAAVATQWRDGLAAWQQQPERIAKFRDSAEVAIYTPGSSAGRPLNVLRSFAAPPAAVMDDADLVRDRITSAASGLLALLNIDADPVRSREHILLSNLLSHHWRAGNDVDLAGLIHGIQAPPFTKVGILDLDTFFPAKDRNDLAMRLNSLLASPSFEAYLQGEPIDVQRLLYTREGKPRLSIISVAHLSDSERMFFITILLNEVLAWVRSQSGTSSLRALLYMDEVFGYFPPTANPPSKLPMLTLLKQARAYGLGIVLATQNPVDLDYKGLANTGTWFLGRLQTERDKLRVLDGLEGASAQAGATFDRAKLERTLSSLGNRVFLMSNVHEDAPVLFQTRWALSYLRGPLTRAQIKTLVQEEREQESGVRKEVSAVRDQGSGSASQPVEAVAAGASGARPIVSPEITQVFVAAATVGGQRKLLYRPSLAAWVRLHFAKAKPSVDLWRKCGVWRLLHEEPDGNIWDHAETFDAEGIEFSDSPDDEATFAELPAVLSSPKKYSSFDKQLRSYLFRTQSVTVWHCARLKATSQPDQDEGEFRIRLSQLAREARDREVEKLRKKYAPKLQTIENQIRSAEERLAREKTQYEQAKLGSAISMGASILGALFGRKLASAANVQRTATSARSAGRALGQGKDIAPAEKRIEEALARREALDHEFDEEKATLESHYDTTALEIEPINISPRKTDFELVRLGIAWLPHWVDGAGVCEKAWE